MRSKLIRIGRIREKLMGVRETIREHPTPVTIATFAIIAVVVVTMWWQTSGNSPDGRSKQRNAFYTSSDGNIFFVDDATRIPPYSRNGAVVVGCEVFAGNSDRSMPFAGYLKRYTPDAHRRLEDLLRQKPPVDSHTLDVARNTGLEVKVARDPDAPWIPLDSAAGAKLIDDVLHGHDDAGRPLHVVTP